MSAYETGQSSYPDPSPERWREMYMEAAAELERLRADLARAEADAASLRVGLRFYGRAQHYVLDDSEEFDTVSGEPQNWLFSGREDSATMVEDGSIARRVLRGEVVDWGEDGPPEQVAGEGAAIAAQGFTAAAIAAARAEGAEQQTKRLRWIESALFERHWNGAIDGGSRTYWRLAGNYRHATAHMVGDTFDEAVDAALRALPVEAPNV